MQGPELRLGQDRSRISGWANPRQAQSGHSSRWDQLKTICRILDGRPSKRTLVVHSWWFKSDFERADLGWIIPQRPRRTDNPNQSVVQAQPRQIPGPKVHWEFWRCWFSCLLVQSSVGQDRSEHIGTSKQGLGRETACWIPRHLQGSKPQAWNRYCS